MSGITEYAIADIFNYIEQVITAILLGKKTKILLLLVSHITLSFPFSCNPFSEIKLIKTSFCDTSTKKENLF